MSIALFTRKRSHRINQKAKLVQWGNKLKASMPLPLKQSKMMSFLKEALLCLRIIGANSCLSRCVCVCVCECAGVCVAVDEMHTYIHVVLPNCAEC